MKLSKCCSAFASFLWLILLPLGTCDNESTGVQKFQGKQPEQEIRFVDEFISFTQFAQLPLQEMPRREAWQQAVPGVKEITIPRQGGEEGQAALWYHSGSEKKKPLLLTLHSWRADYRQHYGIPYGAFAARNDWIFIHPDFRGPFSNPDATGSEKAVQDVLAALDYAKRQAPVDEDRIYLAGFSGGAMMALLLTGRYPEKFTAALAWVPVFDLESWHRSVSRLPHGYARQYRMDIEASCGGNPDANEQAKQECRKRSPSAYLANARGKGVKVFISGGIEDHFVPPSQAILAFNALAAKGARIAEEDYRFLDETETLPEGLKGQEEENRFFTEAGLPVVCKRTSEGATLILFDGGHDIVYNAGFAWLSQQHR